MFYNLPSAQGVGVCESGTYKEWAGVCVCGGGGGVMYTYKVCIQIIFHKVG